ncbi:MAG: AIPR family protein, partial [Butyrivibrio sp.]|nr:AIPR family protein [Butyrivibrio sp.]
FDLDGKEVKLTNFSIVNGGQTTYKIARNKNISEEYDFYLPCKIIRIIGDKSHTLLRYSCFWQSYMWSDRRLQ